MILGALSTGSGELLVLRHQLAVLRRQGLIRTRMRR
jgi:hypothetical protein